MADGYLSEIRMVGFTFPPKGWAFCDGSLLPIDQHRALFNLLGATFGGNGVTTFALPDLRGRVPVHRGQEIPLGVRGGQHHHTLDNREVPGGHTHLAMASVANGETRTASGNALAQARNLYRSPQGDDKGTTMDSVEVQSTGGMPHENRQPYLAIAFCICIEGVVPSKPNPPRS